MKVLLCLCILTCAFHQAVAQTVQKVYYDSAWQKTTDSASAKYYRLLNRDIDNNVIGMIRDYYITGELQWEGKKTMNFTGANSKALDSICTWYYKSGGKRSRCNYIDEKRNGLYLHWDKAGRVSDSCYYANDSITGKYFSFGLNGKPDMIIDYINGKYDGALKTYYLNGQMRRNDIYSKDKFIKGICYDSIGNKVKYYPYAEEAKFSKGEDGFSKYLAHKIKYPKKARENGIEGITSVQFLVDSTGMVKKVKIVKSSGNEELDMEAFRVINNMPRWKPGTLEGKTISIIYVVPVHFKLN